MTLLPIENLLLRSDVSIEALRDRLAQAIGPPRGLNLLASRPEPYLGKLEGDRFSAMRQSSIRNSFKPVIHGRLLEVGSGSYVHLVMRPSSAVAIFMIFWFGMLAYSQVSAVISAVADSTVGWQRLPELLPELLIPLGFMLFGYLLMMAAFKFEAKKSKGFFIDLIEPYCIEDLGFFAIWRPA